ncbi:MAG: DUF402 domain-containing protein [Acidimicrobiia bacterium]
MRPVTVQFLKNPHILHWGFEAVWLGEDEHGRWIALPNGSRRWKGQQEVRPAAEDAVFCAPHDAWWHLHYNGALSQFSHFVDIVTPPVWVSDNRYEMIDLDLDVTRSHNGTIAVEDEDEFEIHQLKYGYSDQMIERARAETDWVVAALAAGSEPFFEVAAAWLARV